MRFRCTHGTGYSLSFAGLLRVSISMFALLKCSTHMSFGGIRGRSFNQEVYRGLLILEGSGYLSTSPEETSLSSVDSNVPVLHEAYADKSGIRKFFYPECSDEFVEDLDQRPEMTSVICCRCCVDQADNVRGWLTRTPENPARG